MVINVFIFDSLPALFLFTAFHCNLRLLTYFVKVINTEIWPVKHFYPVKVMMFYIVIFSRKKFQPGEKATFANNDEHWCHSCQLQHQEQEQQQPSPVPTQLVPGFREAGAASATPVEIPMSPLSISDENEKPESPQLEVEPTQTSLSFSFYLLYFLVSKP